MAEPGFTVSRVSLVQFELISKLTILYDRFERRLFHATFSFEDNKEGVNAFVGFDAPPLLQCHTHTDASSFLGPEAYPCFPAQVGPGSECASSVQEMDGRAKIASISVWPPRVKIKTVPMWTLRVKSSGHNVRFTSQEQPTNAMICTPPQISYFSEETPRT